MLAILAGVMAMSNISMGAAPSGRSSTDWFQKAGYGVFVHYLEGLQNNPDEAHSLGRRTGWDECVREFNTERFAAQVSETGAAYVVFTMMQLTRHLVAPNATFDRMTGYKPGEACSTRDLVMDLYRSLHKRGILLMLYWTGDGPSRDPKAAAGLDCPVNGKVSEQFVRNWAAVAAEYGERYGPRVAGWWCDGSYPWLGYDETTLGILAAGMKAGGGNRIVALNPGVNDRVRPYSRHEDYTCGEQNDFVDIPSSRYVDGEQWHLLSYLGTNWGQPGTRLKKQALADYIHAVNAVGGVVSVDLMLYRDGSLDRSQVEVMRGLRQGLKDRKADLEAWKTGGAVPAGNRAWRKAARLLSLDGSHELIPSVGDIHAAGKGVDGDPGTCAVGGGEYAWSYQVDLLDLDQASRVVVQFGQGYPTEMEILVSADGAGWDTVQSASGHGGAAVDVRFDPRPVRYVRVSGRKPDGPGQVGVQMAIAELQVYR